MLVSGNVNTNTFYVNVYFPISIDDYRIQQPQKLLRCKVTRCTLNRDNFTQKSIQTQLCTVPHTEEKVL